MRGRARRPRAAPSSSCRASPARPSRPTPSAAPSSRRSATPASTRRSASSSSPTRAPRSTRRRAAGYRVFNADPNVGGRYSALTAFGLVPIGPRRRRHRGAARRGRGGRRPARRRRRRQPRPASSARRSPAPQPLRDKLVLVDDGTEHRRLRATGPSSSSPSPPARTAPASCPSSSSTPTPPRSPRRRRHRRAPRVDSDDDTDAAGCRGRAGRTRREVTVAGTLGAQLLLWEYATAVAGRLLGHQPVRPARRRDRQEGRPRAARRRHGAGRGPRLHRRRRRGARHSAATGSARVDRRGGGRRAARRSSTASTATSRSWPTSTAWPTPTLGQRRARRWPPAPAARSPSAGARGSCTRPASSTRAARPIGVYLQITTAPAEDLAVPGRPFTFGELIAAQAGGDAQVLADHGRPVLRLHLTDHDAGLAAGARASLESARTRSEPGPRRRTATNPLRDPRDKRLPRIAGPCGARDLRRDRRPGPQEAHARRLRPRQPRAAAAGLRARRVRPPRLGRPGLRQGRPRRRQAARPHAVPRGGLARSSPRASGSSRATSTTTTAFDRLAARRSPSSTSERGTGGNHAFYLSIPPTVVPAVVPSSSSAPACPTAAPTAVAPRRHREAVRPRPEVGPRAQRRRRDGLPARLGLPHRPLPRQGDGPEHPGAALRQPAVRADLERATTSTTCRSRWPRTSASAAGPATTTASARRATSSRTTCCSCSRSPRWRSRSRSTRTDLRAEKEKVLSAVRLPADLATDTARGQYAAGWQGGEQVSATSRRTASPPDSTHRDLRRDHGSTIDTRRWAGVPFYLRTGKRLGRGSPRSRWCSSGHRTCRSSRRRPRSSARTPRHPGPARRGRHDAVRLQGAGHGDGGPRRHDGLRLRARRSPSPPRGLRAADPRRAARRPAAVPAARGGRALLEDPRPDRGVLGEAGPPPEQYPSGTWGPRRRRRDAAPATAATWRRP